jgi:menaquinone-dependent protoporphyrinogen IX oxidase
MHMKVLLSYADADREVAKEVASHLAEAGHDVWDPGDTLFPGDN